MKSTPRPAVMPTIKSIRHNTTNQRICVACGRSGDVFDCEGCRVVLCARHLRKHRQQLTYQLEDVMHSCDLLRQDIEDAPHEHSYLRKVDKWERESIQKIQIAAEKVRVDVRQILDKTKRRLTRISRAMAMDLKSSYQADDFLEKDLSRWTKQLSHLRSEMQFSSSLELKEDQQSPIYLVRIVHKKLSTFPKEINRQPHSNLKEHFSKAIHPASVEDDGLTVKQTGMDLDYGYVIGSQLYSQGRHTTRLKILSHTSPYMIFLGCISSVRIPETIHYRSPFTVGWFGHNEVYEHGIWRNNVQTHGYESNEIQTEDVLGLTFDCDRRQLVLLHERLNKTYKLPVNVEKAPFPWQLLVVLVHAGDSVKILPGR